MPALALLIIIGLVYFVIKVFAFIVDAFSSVENHNKLQTMRDSKYRARSIDNSKSLFDRNLDIIRSHGEKISAHSYHSFYIENLTRDCLNEICLAENQIYLQPGSKYLRDWKNTASKEWLQLSSQIEHYFEALKIELEKAAELKKAQVRLNEKLHKEIHEQVNKIYADLKHQISNKKSPKEFREIIKRVGRGNIFLENIDSILRPNLEAWKDKELQLINKDFIPQEFPGFTSPIITNEVSVLNSEIVIYNAEIQQEISEHEENSTFFQKIGSGFNHGIKKDVLQRIDYILNDIRFPSSFPKLWESDFDREQSILIVELGLPDVVHTQIMKKVELKSRIADKALTKREIKEYVPKIHPAVILRVAYEIFRNDEAGTIKLLVLNGWVEYDDPATGVKTKAYTSSLVVNRDQILGLNLERLDPLAAFLGLKGKSAGALIDIIPVVPTLSLNRKDKRFIATKEVLNKIGKETNLASMDWQDFESLIAELFEKEFADKGAEVKVTQSSRDRGVDAIVFDPDPIKGGKFVIQAKRYTKTVDVSAVRDLCAVVKKEGASRGILVTTSSYGADAYTFAQNEPITLLNGAELLGLLEKHGYKFRIDISEARKLLKEMELRQ